ncbi:hypothetical protein PR048_032925 [Dryococelus australis]|uniref:Uncharacterized protein n=1 Tax=Dryococelus australis TaxID=614101 RepID=A0ABQ9G4D0_9NEOP|nr:hypothetical protein PR048_032925 [Dryococelus australis]
MKSKDNTELERFSVRWVMNVTETFTTVWMIHKVITNQMKTQKTLVYKKVLHLPVKQRKNHLPGNIYLFIGIVCFLLEMWQHCMWSETDSERTFSYSYNGMYKRTHSSLAISEKISINNLPLVLSCQQPCTIFLFKSFSETQKIVKKYVTPTIRMMWLGEQRSYLETCSASNSDMWLFGDGQFDSPGFMCKIVDFVVLQKEQVDRELEKPACKTLLERLTQKFKVIFLFLTDIVESVN